jgi:hypothetical protein
MRLTIDMPIVSQCVVSECAYNLEKKCHARAITVGDGVHPGCDTYLYNHAHTREKARIAGVGACKVSECRYNDDFECSAKEISVGYADGAINCLTFSAR